MKNIIKLYIIGALMLNGVWVYGGNNTAVDLLSMGEVEFAGSNYTQEAEAEQSDDFEGLKVDFNDEDLPKILGYIEFDSEFEKSAYSWLIKYLCSQGYVHDGLKFDRKLLNDLEFNGIVTYESVVEEMLFNSESTDDLVSWLSKNSDQVDSVYSYILTTEMWIAPYSRDEAITRVQMGGFFISDACNLYKALVDCKIPEEELVPLIESGFLNNKDENKKVIELLSTGSGWYDMLAHMVNELGFVLVGFNNAEGPFSRYFSDIGDRFATGSNLVVIVPIDEEDVENEVLLGLFSGFINPGNHDNYPRDNEPFNSDVMQERYTDMDKSYHRVVDFAKAKNVPLLGMCAGNQHLILNSGGYVKKLPEENGSEDTYVRLLAGSVNHYWALNKEEKKEVLGNCDIQDIEFYNAHTKHSYGGHAAKLGNTKLGAVYQDGEVAGVHYGSKIVGYQFHPENLYLFGDSSICTNEDTERQINILDSFFEECRRFAQMHKIANEVSMSKEELNEWLVRDEQVTLSALLHCSK